MGKPFSGFICFIRSLCVSLALGLPGCSSLNTTIASQLTLLVKEDSFVRRNIGLMGGAPAIAGDSTLNHISDPTHNDGILLQLFQGAWDGALSGMEAEQFFCWSGSGTRGQTLYFSGHVSGTDALVFLILCGEGVVAGMSIGGAVGIVTPLVSPEETSEILIARQHVIEGVWKEFTTTTKRESVQSHGLDDSSSVSSHHRIIFGNNAQLFTAFMRLEHIRVGLFPKSYFDAGALTLVWNIQIAFFDDRRRVVATQMIEMEQGEHSFQEWADQNAFFFKKEIARGL